MAPEQLDNRGLGPWTDLYAVGVMAFEFWSGQCAFPGDSVPQIFALKVNPQYDPLERLAGQKLPPGPLAFLRKALAPEPANRFQDAEQMQGELLGALEELELAPGRPLERISLSGLVMPVTELAKDTTAPQPAGQPVRDMRERSDQALRRWLEDEGQRLQHDAQRLERRGRRQR
jgi:serine/threonine protein kinase